VGAGDRFRPLPRCLMTTSVRLLQITDLHLREDPQGHLRGAVTLATLESCLLAAQATGPYDAILVTGDLVQDEPMAYAHLQRVLQHSAVPVVCLPGNHDDPERLAAAFHTPPFQTLGHLRLGDWLIIGLDSTVPRQDGGRLSPEEITRLESTLAAHPDQHALIALHHPPVRLGSHWLDALGLADAEYFWATVDRYPHVRGVVFGHAHQVYEGVRGHVTVLGAPATSAQFLPYSDDFAIDDRPPGWRVLTLQPDGHIASHIGWLTDT
jgi:3',5'-cyclic-AMP phosphodiesterase